MLTPTELQTCYNNLYTYDVTQGAWEQEPHGFEANARHVLTHLTKDLLAKDFKDPETVKTAIAPDSLQYALRFARWADLPPAELDFKEQDRQRIFTVASRLGRVSYHFAAFTEAAGTLAQNLHDLDHGNTSAEAQAGRKTAMAATASSLLLSADLASQRFDFDLVEAFDARLSSLRIRFGIPEPGAR